MTQLYDAYRVVCPDCGAAKNRACVYLPLPNVDPEFVHFRSRKIQERVALTGTPTKRPHNGRLFRLHELRLRAIRRASVPVVPPVDEDRLAAARAEREFDLREYERLRAWLRVNAGIFRQSSPA